jgi:hypothetical protein
MGNVKLYRSSDYGAPLLYGNAGYLLPVLDACLVNGYGQQNIYSLTHDNGTVTAVTSIAHGLQPYSRQTITGANESGYNGEFIISVLDAFSFYYTASGIAASPATGTITTKSAGAGWTSEFTSGSISVYRPGAGPRHYLRIDDTTTISARCIGYETMTGVSTGTGPFPTTAQQSGGLYWQKTNVADSTSDREWIIIADDRTMYMWVKFGTTLDYSWITMHGFGELYSYKSGDAYNTFISANSGASSYQYMLFSSIFSAANGVTSASVTGMYAPRSYTQAGSSCVLGKICDYSKSPQLSFGGSTITSLPYPHPVDGGLHMCTVGVVDGIGTGPQAVIRGRLRGIWNPLHPQPLNQGDIFVGNGSTNGKTFYTLTTCGAVTNTGCCMVDISLTW